MEQLSNAIYDPLSASLYLHSWLYPSSFLPHLSHNPSKSFPHPFSWKRWSWISLLVRLSRFEVIAAVASLDALHWFHLIFYWWFNFLLMVLDSFFIRSPLNWKRKTRQSLWTKACSTLKMGQTSDAEKKVKGLRHCCVKSIWNQE